MCVLVILFCLTTSSYSRALIGQNMSGFKPIFWKLPAKVRRPNEEGSTKTAQLAAQLAGPSLWYLGRKKYLARGSKWPRSIVTGTNTWLRVIPCEKTLLHAPFGSYSDRTNKIQTAVYVYWLLGWQERIPGFACNMYRVWENNTSCAVRVIFRSAQQDLLCLGHQCELWGHLAPQIHD